MVNGVKIGASIKPAITPDILSSIFIEHTKKPDMISNRKYAIEDIRSSNSVPDMDYGNNEKISEYGLENPSESTFEPSKYDLKIEPNSSRRHSSDSPESNLFSNSQNADAGRTPANNSNNSLENSSSSSSVSTTDGAFIGHPFSKFYNIQRQAESMKAENDSSFNKIEKISDKGNLQSPVPSNNRITDNEQASHLNFLNNLRTETERNDYKNLYNRFSKITASKAAFEPTITINIGKITVKASKDIRSLSNNINKVGSGGPKVQSLNEYLNKKRSKI